MFLHVPGVGKQYATRHTARELAVPAEDSLGSLALAAVRDARHHSLDPRSLAGHRRHSSRRLT